MNPVDIAILTIVGLSAFFGLLRGAVREVFGLAAFLLGFVLAVLWYGIAAEKLAPWISEPLLAQALAFFGIMLAAWAFFAIGGALLRSFLKLLSLTWLDRLGGLAFGLVRGTVVVALLAWSFTAFQIQPRQMIQSDLSRWILDIGEQTMGIFPEDYSDRFTEGLRAMRAYSSLSIMD